MQYSTNRVVLFRYVGTIYLLLQNNTQHSSFFYPNKWPISTRFFQPHQRVFGVTFLALILQRISTLTTLLTLNCPNCGSINHPHFNKEVMKLNKMHERFQYWNRLCILFNLSTLDNRSVRHAFMCDKSIPSRSSSSMGGHIFLTSGLFSTRGLILTYSQISFPTFKHCTGKRGYSNIISIWKCSY